MQKVRDHCRYTGKYRGAAHSNCNLNYKITKKIPLVFHNGSTYGYHFIIKQLAREFKGYFECLGDNTEKYITFSVPIKKEHDNGKTTTYKLKFINSYKFMQDSLSNLVDNLSEINNKEPKINLQIAGDLWQIHYHSLLIKYQRLIEKYHKLIKKNKKINLPIT